MGWPPPRLLTAGAFHCCGHWCTRAVRMCVETTIVKRSSESLSPADTEPETHRIGGGEYLEPISKSSEEDNEACELDKAEEVLSVVLPADEYATLPLYPGEEALDEPAPLVTA